MQTTRDEKIRKEYLDRYGEKGLVNTIGKKYKLSRSQVYSIINEVTEQKYKKWFSNHLDELWAKYKPKWDALPKDRKSETVSARAKIVRAMFLDGFNFNQIAKRTKYHHTTISDLYNRK